jgi:thiamine-monophosphate kinase
LRRDGARVGDSVWVSGTLGDAAAALDALDTAPGLSGESCDALRARLHRPSPRVALGILLRDIASACIDISDGLLADLGHVATASSVGMEIEVKRLPASAALRDARSAQDRQLLQLAGGDDYELAFTVAPERVPALRQAVERLSIQVTEVGRVVGGTGVRALDADGRPFDVPRTGWEHFR